MLTGAVISPIISSALKAEKISTSSCPSGNSGWIRCRFRFETQFIFSLITGAMLRSPVLLVFLMLISAVLILPDLCLADDDTHKLSAQRRSTLSFIYENDIFNRSDGHYTNGVRVSWVPSSADTPEWALSIARVIPWFPADGEVRHGYSIGQSMFTSDDITQKNPPEDSRPYAGWLYANIGLAVETGQLLDQLILTLGIVGPASLADKTQRLVHEMVGSDEPQGWGYQLRNEPGVMVSWQRSWRALAVQPLVGRQLDLTPYVGISLGNVYTGSGIGFFLRYGSNLPLDYGPPRIQPGGVGTSSYVPTSQIGWYLFGGVEGRAVARNIFLDGNSFRSSRSVDKKYLVGDVQAGGVLVWNRLRLSYTHVWRTREFKTQESRDTFGSVAMSILF